MLASALLIGLCGLQLASECGVVNDRCGYDTNGKPVRNTQLERGHPSLTFHPEDHAHECCDGLMCDDGTCRRPWGNQVPTAEDLMAAYDKWSPATGISLERAKQMLLGWQGREERVLTSVRLKYSSSQPKDEI